LPNENPDDFESFRTGLLNDLAPEGEVEGVLAQKIVADAWHLRRVPIFEATLYRRGSADLLASQARKAIAVRQHASTEKDWVLAARRRKTPSIGARASRLNSMITSRACWKSIQEHS